MTIPTLVFPLNKQLPTLLPSPNGTQPKYVTHGRPKQRVFGAGGCPTPKYTHSQNGKREVHGSKQLLWVSSNIMRCKWKDLFPLDAPQISVVNRSRVGQEPLYFTYQFI